jgi:small nuclear ribonucleoprotein (snRNP)-like protein
MVNRNWRLLFLGMLSLCVFCAGPLAAIDVVYVNNGDIILGTLIGPVPGGVSYSTFGIEKTISFDSITATEKNLSGLAEKTVQVALKDGSVIQGKIVDFDEDIGVFLDIAFGTLTIPGIAVSEIYELDKRTRYTGAAYQISSYGGVYWPLGDSADYFGMGWSAGAGMAWAIPAVRGLYAGGRATFYGMDYTDDTSIKYVMLSLRPEITYKYLGWRMKNNFLSKIVPYGTFGAGPVYIAIEDPASYPSNYGSIAADMALSAGIEFSVSRNFVLKVEGNGTYVVQEGASFTHAGALLSLCYER